LGIVVGMVRRGTRLVAVIASFAVLAIVGAAPASAAARDVKAVTQAAKKTIAAGTVQYKASVSTASSVIKAAAKAGFEPPRVTMDADLSGSGLPISGVVPGRVLDGDLYLELGNVLPFGTPWVKVDLGSVGGAAGTALSAVGNSSPDLGFGLLLGATSATKAGTDRIRGQSTTHYEVTIDPQAAAASAPAYLRDALTKLVAGGSIDHDELRFDRDLLRPPPLRHPGQRRGPARVAGDRHHDVARIAARIVRSRDQRVASRAGARHQGGRALQVV
jgi:hypothetical protein